MLVVISLVLVVSCWLLAAALQRPLFSWETLMRCAAVGGGPVSLQKVLEAIEGGFPMVVVKGTGRVADLICAVREQQSMRFLRNQCIGACASNNAQLMF